MSGDIKDVGEPSRVREQLSGPEKNIVENAHQFEQLEKEEEKTDPRFFHESEQLLIKARAEREQAEDALQVLAARKAAAEEKIRNTVKERLKRAEKIGIDKAREVSLIHFVMGGLKLDTTEVAGMRIVTSWREVGTTALISTCGFSHKLAVRVEKNPGYPTFLVRDYHGIQVGLTPEEKESLAKLEATLKTYMKSYALVSDQVLEEVWK